MIILDSLLIGGLRFVLDQVATAVDQEMNDETSLRQDLLAAQMQLELGEMDDEEFVELEQNIMARLREIRAQREDEMGGRGALEFDAGRMGVDVSFGGEEE